MNQEKKGLITQELFEYTLNNLRHYKETNNQIGIIKKMKIIHEEYVPFYSLGFNPPSNLPTARLLAEDYNADSFEEIYGTEITSSPSYLKFLKRCMEKKYYSLILMLAPTKKVGSKLFEELDAVFWRFINNHYDTQFTSCTSFMGSSPLEDIYNRVRLFSTWAISHYKFRKAEPKTYVSNMYFLAEMIGKVVRVDVDLKVLFTVMVKKTSVPMIRAYFATNTPIPASLLELWVDNSLEAANSMKPYFRKFIKSKFEASGVAIKYFDNLTSEILSVLKMPVFNTIAEKVEWQQGKLREFYRMERKEIVYTAGRPVVAGPEIAALQEKFRAMAAEASWVQPPETNAVDQTIVLPQNIANGTSITIPATQGYVTFDADAPF